MDSPTMAQVDSRPSKLFITPFDCPMIKEEEDDIRPHPSSWGLSLSTMIPKFTPSEWFNPSPDNITSDYFTAPLSCQNLELDAQIQNPLNGALAPSFWLFQTNTDSASGSTPTSGTSGNGSSSSFPSPFLAHNNVDLAFTTQSAPSSYSSSLFDRPNAIPTSLLVSPPKPSASPLIRTPVISANASMAIDSPESYDDFDRKVHVTSTRSCGHGRAAKRRGSSFSSEEEEDHVDEEQYEIHEGVERDGMIWGMKVDDYRALSARERKRVRNRISARTFRAKRKEHLTTLEIDLNAKDAKIKTAHDEAVKLRKQVLDLKKRLAKYEAV